MAELHAQVGPAPAEEGDAGRFQNLVQSRVVRGEGAAAPDQALRDQAGQRQPERGRHMHVAAQPFMKPNMYDWIPPVSGGSSSAGAS
jgi:hypothetical protein